MTSPWLTGYQAVTSAVTGSVLRGVAGVALALVSDQETGAEAEAASVRRSDRRDRVGELTGIGREGAC